MGVFEGVRAYETPKWYCNLPFTRPYQTLIKFSKIYQMNVPFDQATLEQAQIDGS